MAKTFHIMEKRELQKEFNKLAKKANARMERWIPGDLKKSPAYQMVESFLGTPFVKEERVRKYSRYKKTRFETIDLRKKNTKQQRMSEEELIQGIKVIKSFLNAKTSTMKGWKEAKKQRSEELKNKYPGLSYADREKLLDWLGSDQGKLAKQDFDSHQVRTAMAAHLKTHKNADPFEAFSSNVLNTGKTIADWYRSTEEPFGRL